MIRATKSADCAEIGMLRKIGRSTHFGEIGESPDKIIFYCQHNKLQLLDTDAKSPLAQRCVMQRQRRLKQYFAAKILPVRIFEPTCDECFVGQVVRVLEIFKPDHQASRQGRSPVVRAKQRLVRLIETIPIHQLGENTERMVEVQLRIESRLKELELRF